MTALGRLVLALARLLEDEERATVGHRLAEGVHDVGSRSPSRDEHADDEVDWSYLWQALLDASDHAHRIVTLLESERISFDVSAITEEARVLRSQINATYELMCEAKALDGLALAAHASIEEIWMQSVLHRAALVDADLDSMHWASEPDAPAWTIDVDEHGGFVATTSEVTDAGPWKFWGSAATAASAAHTLLWFFHDRPPNIMFDPPASRRPLVSNVVNADRSPEGPTVPELLVRRDAIYVEHVTAVQQARDALHRRGQDIEGFLAERANELNATDTQRLLHNKALTAIAPGSNRDHLGFASTVMWVPTRLVVGTRHPVWGDFGGHRDEIPVDIASGLLDAEDLDTFTAKFFSPKIDLMMAPGWTGPLYHVGSDGNHRVHTARMLGLPWLAAAIKVQAIRPSSGIIDLLNMDPDDGAKIQSFERRMRDRTELVIGLLRRGVIAGELTGDRGETLRFRRLPAAWLLHRAEYATAINAIYEKCYPGALAQLGIPLEAGTDPVAWRCWLAGA
ncbi:hypothetical protein BS329_17890 [Amycolatopsis coloradensis]|uniref:Uncharacterized protein n=1 Tax=Amycolatopsis coloradensis TaxID=76021 RepID=A0A1R0KT36_9PSEU|nr:hypothetical protein [Amycolatopsis coloradensis]OLZ51113.1 hypothetical protein BS329_17890 [Amycolatopsis coloradensis]